MTFLIYKIPILILLISISLNISAQTKLSILDSPVTLDTKDRPTKEILQAISAQTGIGFSYSDNLIVIPLNGTIKTKNKPLKKVLEQLLANSNIDFQVIGNQIVFKNHKKVLPKKFTINGYVSDKKTGERLIMATIYDSITSNAITTNAFGFYSITLYEGMHSMIYSYMGYLNQKSSFSLKGDTILNVLLELKTQQINEIQVIYSKKEVNLSKPQMGMMTINSKEVKKIPSLLGEADVMRAIQILPGIQAANERSTGISVRGGSIDQNLFLLDDAPIFQISHMVGFYSVFNNEAVKDIKLYKGDIPANYGGRLASLVDIRLKDGNMHNYSVSGGIGLIATNLSVEGPIIKDKISFITSGKYSYVGALLKLMNVNSNINFYDFNCKLNAIINAKNRIYLSSYYGGDNASLSLMSKYSNTTASLRWNHEYNPKIFSNISLIYSNYSFKSTSSNKINESFDYIWKSGIEQVSLKADYSYYLNHRHTIDFGLSSTFFDFNPGKLEGNINAINSITSHTPFSNRITNKQNVMEQAVYVSDQYKFSNKLSFRLGVRSSLYQNFGGNWVYKLNNYVVTDSFYVSKYHTYANYMSLEPRLSLNYRISENSAFKSSYTYTSQQTQLLMKTTGGGPLDVWFPSGINIKPQTSSQYSISYNQYLFKNSLEIIIEQYYKNMNHIIDYKDGAKFLNKSNYNSINKSNYNFEEELRTGNGYAYGTEFMIKGDYQKIDGSVSYTYARSYRKIPDINFGEKYLSPFDKPHTLDLFLNYSLSKRFSFSANFRFQSGQVTTVPIYTIEMFGKTLKGYSKRNEYRLPNYQRLDISITWKNKEKPGKRYQSEWNFSIINVLNHNNILYVDFVTSSENSNIITAKGTSILGFVPSVSYHFNF